MIDIPDSPEMPSPDALNSWEIDARPRDPGEDRAEALHRMSQRFGQRIEQARGSTRNYLKLLK